jgi:hypothetical protein
VPGNALGTRLDPAYLGAVHRDSRRRVVIDPSALPYDPTDPPYRAPDACFNPLMWQLAWQVFHDHRRVTDGWCAACRPYQFYPCIRRQLADIGLAAACTDPARATWNVPAPRSSVARPSQ